MDHLFEGEESEVCSELQGILDVHRYCVGRQSRGFKNRDVFYKGVSCCILTLISL